MNDRQTLSPRRRLQLLRAIPDSQRTEAEWDELNELEIMLAPENRLTPSAHPPPREGNGAPVVHPPRPSSHPPAPAGGNPAARRKPMKRPPRRPGDAGGENGG